MAAHRLVEVHGVEARRVEVGRPHVADDDQFEGVVRAAEAVGEGLAAAFVADVGLPVGGVGGRTGHHHFDPAALLVQVLPFRAQADDLAVEFHGDATAHADDHAFAFQGFQAALEVFDDVLYQELQAARRGDDGL